MWRKLGASRTLRPRPRCLSDQCFPTSVLRVRVGFAFIVVYEKHSGIEIFSMLTPLSSQWPRGPLGNAYRRRPPCPNKQRVLRPHSLFWCDSAFGFFSVICLSDGFIVQRHLYCHRKWAPRPLPLHSSQGQGDLESVVRRNKNILAIDRNLDSTSPPLQSITDQATGTANNDSTGATGARRR